MICEVSDPEARKITVEGLTPFMQYKLRLIANNVEGPSKPSEPTKEFQTIQAPPSHPPRNVTVRAVSATELRVRWIVSVYKYLLQRSCAFLFSIVLPSEFSAPDVDCVINFVRSLCFTFLEFSFDLFSAAATVRVVRKPEGIQHHLHGNQK